MNMAPRTPAAAASVVVRAMSATWVLAAIVDPGLKPYQPTPQIRTPRTASGILWPGRVAVGARCEPGAVRHVGSGVKAVPAAPQDQDSEDGERHIVAGDVDGTAIVVV